jgi:hypothetical protein
MEHAMCGSENIDDNRQSGEPGDRENWDIAGKLKPLEARLAALSPCPDRLDRDRLMFLAGQASLVDAKFERVRTLGSRLESGVWPAAFVAMSAVAATLFVMLVGARERFAPPASSAAVSGHSDRAPLAIEWSSADPVLSAGDAYAVSIESLLASDDLRSDIGSSSSDPFETRDRPILTPAGWGQILNEAMDFQGSRPGASTIHPIQGVNS